MRLRTWIQSWLNPRPAPAHSPTPAQPPASTPLGLVRFFDVPSQRVVHIPASELRPGCVEAKIDGIEGIVWVSPEQLQQGPIRHPPFSEEIRVYIRQIQTTFAEHYDLSAEEWEEGFRRDEHPEREIAGFVYAARVYRQFADDEPSALRRRDVYRLLIACMTASPETLWHVVKLEALSRPEAERIVHRFYNRETAEGPAGKAPTESR